MDGQQQVDANESTNFRFSISGCRLNSVVAKICRSKRAVISTLIKTGLQSGFYLALKTRLNDFDAL